MTTIELTKSGIAMKKFRSDPQNALNERRKDVLRREVASLLLKIGRSMDSQLRRS